MEDTRESIYTCDHMGGAIWAAITRWAEQGVTDEVVRCKDCEYLEVTPAGRYEVRLACVRQRGRAFPVSGVDYCSWGRRREG